jgi:hypothetical protein
MRSEALIKTLPLDNSRMEKSEVKAACGSALYKEVENDWEGVRVLGEVGRKLVKN